MTVCSVKIYKDEFLDKIADEILNLTFAFDGKSTQLTMLASGLGLDIYNATFADDNIAGILRIEGKKYNIYVNSRQPVVRQRFTVAHEISHFILHKDLIHEQNGSIFFRKDFNFAPNIMETQANKLAAALLMPKNQILKAWEVFKNIEEVADMFVTSKQTTYIRLNRLGAIK